MAEMGMFRRMYGVIKLDRISNESVLKRDNGNNNFYLYSAIKSNQYNCSVALYNEEISKRMQDSSRLEWYLM